ncbi:MAG TPA: exonuclease domain-containing protein [Candidatus Omnitrophota bacterium]|nr:exonuclease domain-containing protein [Candidatus Omnitrophota bacterium]
MPQRVRGPFPWLAAAFAANVVVTVAAAYFLGRGVVDHEELTALTLVSVSGAAALFALSWKIVDYQMVRAIRRMAAEVRAIAHGGSREGVDADRYGVVSPLPEAVNELCVRLVQARKELAEGLSAATARAEETSTRLAAILNDLHEGVVVCNLKHQVVLYNQVATDMLHAEMGQLGLGRSLLESVAREPVVHMLEVLTHRPELGGRGTPFLAGTSDGRMLLQARMTLIRSGDEATGYVVTLVDAGQQIEALGQRDVLLREVAEGLELPLKRLKAAAGDAEVVAREAAAIEKSIKRVTDGYSRALSGWWPMSDLSSPDLFGFICRRFEGEVVKINLTDLPVWLHGDSHSLVLALEALIRQVVGKTGVGEIDLAASCTDDEAFLDIRWRGAAVADDVLTGWLSQPLPALGGMTVRDVLMHHAGDAIDQSQRDGWAGLCLPMRKGVEVQFKPKEVLPTRRPEFYDMSLLQQARDTGEFGGVPLKSLTFVVFDTETTGLQPSQGDQIVQIGAVRVVNGRILSGEGFNRIVNPGRPIPPASIVFHGITDEMARDKPPIGVVLPQFKAYASDAILVAHNAAFDLKFLKMRERECGVRFDNPVLDTMILSNYLDGPEAGHSLDSICERFGIEITDRHTALGDAIVTAAVLLRQIEALEARGLHTLDDVVKAVDITMQLHQRQMAL